MKIGLQTISWGACPGGVGELVRCASCLDCVGIEFAQALDVLGPIDELLATITASSIRIAGLAGGSLAARLSPALRIRPDYLYADEWDQEAVERALDAGLTVALHPHFCKHLDTIESVVPYLEKYPELGLILDTAHQYLANDDVLEMYKLFAARVVSIHLKDWQPRFGRSPQHFARGFTYLGGGILGDNIRQLLLSTKERDYSGWLIIEQDSPPGAPCEYAGKSREWLRTLGI
jgi:sugar phosphate isomerase/epimerase